MSSESTENQISVPLVCEGSRFAGLGDGQGFMAKFQDLISLMEFIAIFFYCVRRTLPRFLQNLSFDKKLAENQNLPFPKRFLGFVHFF